MKANWVLPVIILVAVAAVGISIWNRPQQTEADAAPKPTESSGIVAFRMEQQWLIHLKLALAEEAQLSPQIYSTGRVIPVASTRTVVAPPVGGVIASRTLPTIGQNVTRGQVLATLLQTPTAAEAAQIRIENSRVDAERRKLAQMEIDARGRLAAATAEAERAK